MNSVRCPMCDVRLKGDDCDGLTVVLRGHLESEHNIQELCNAATGGVPPSTMARSYEPPGEEEKAYIRPTEEERERMKLGNRMREAEVHRDQEAWGPPASREAAERPHGVGNWVRRNLGLGYGDRSDAGEWARGQAPEGSVIKDAYERERDKRKDEIGGREPPGPSPGPSLGNRHGDHVDCPMCGMHLSGDDEEELSITLREHMISMHEVAPLLTLRPRQ